MHPTKHTSRTRLRTLLAGTAATALLATVAGTAHGSPGSAATASGRYTVTVGSQGSYPYPTDTPASPFVDANGTFHFQQSASLYGADDVHEWEFYTGRTMDTARKDVALSSAKDPDNPQDSNSDTTWRCLNGPTGKIATKAPAGSGYDLANYCDLVGTWVDPDTGYWIGLVHNEFTPQPFGDGLHMDSIDYAVSTDHGKTWSIKGHAITSPYSTDRGDTKAFPEQTFYYGDGDPRLYVDQASGYFYVYYGSRVVDKNGGWGGFSEHVARAPMSAKMATGSWQKYYGGTWHQPGVGGKESDLVSTARSSTGYLPASASYNPKNTGTIAQQQAAGTMPANSDLFILNITYDAYLGKYLGTPEHTTDDAPQRIYATSSLSHPRWSLLGDTGSTYRTNSWYRWFLDPVSATQGTIVGRTFRTYCSIECNAGSDGDFATVTVDSSTPVAAPVRTDRSYLLVSGSGQVLGRSATTGARIAATSNRKSALAKWKFRSDKDGSYTVINTSSGLALGVDDTGNGGRAWGAGAVLGGLKKSGPSAGQQWFIRADASGRYRLINRYSGLVLDLGGDNSFARTVPFRSWTGTSGRGGGVAKAATQQLQFVELG